MIAVSRAPYAKLAAYDKRMGWKVTWVSSFGTDFNFDYQASFTAQEVAEKEAFFNFTKQDPSFSGREGFSIFFKDAASRLFRTYSTYARHRHRE